MNMGFSFNNRVVLIFSIAFMFSLSGFGQYEANKREIAAFRNIEEFNANKSTVFEADIYLAKTRWDFVERYKIATHLPKKQVKWFNIYKDKGQLLISSKLFRDGPKYLIEIDQFNGSFGFFRDVDPADEQNNAAVMGGVLGGVAGAVAGAIIESSTKKSVNAKPYTFYIWFPKSKSKYVVTEPLMKSLLKNHPDLLQQWQEEPSEENTIHILNKRHEMTPIMG